MAFLKPRNVRPLCVFTRIMDQTYRVVGRDPSRRSPALTSPRGLPQSPCRNPSGSGGGDVSRGLRVGYFNGEGKERLWGPPAGCTGELGPLPRGLLTDVGMLQKTADSSLSLQLLVIWGQKGTWHHLVALQPVTPRAPRLHAGQTANHETHGQEDLATTSLSVHPGDRCLPRGHVTLCPPPPPRPLAGSAGLEEAAQCLE